MAADDPKDQTMDDAWNIYEASMAEVEAELQTRIEQEARKKKRISGKVRDQFFYDNPEDLPFMKEIPSSSKDKQSYIPMDTEPTEDTSRGRRRPPSKIKTNGGSENTSQKKTKQTPQEPQPMIVNKEGEQQKRTKNKQPTSAAEKKKRKQEEKEVSKTQELLDRIQKRSEKNEAKLLKEQQKAEAKKEKEAKKAEAEAARASRSMTHGVEKIENQSRSFWGRQTITVLKQQAELRGHRFTDQETKGVEKRVNGAITKFKRFKKEDYLDTLLKILKI